MTAPRACAGCLIKPVAFKNRRWCFDCEPSGPHTPPPCRRCQSNVDYFSGGLCRHCHRNGGPIVGSCVDCSAWGVTRTNKWLCHACIGWRESYPAIAACGVCGDVRNIGRGNLCRLCWRQASTARRATRTERPYKPLDVAAANRHGQQLFFANMGNKARWHEPRRPSPSRPAAPTERPRVPKPWRPVPGSRYEQLDLLAVKQPTWTESHGIPEPPDTARAAALNRLAREHAARHGWGKDTLGRARLGLKVVLGLQETPGARFRVSDIMAQLSPHPIPASPVLAVLIEASMLEDDRTPAIQLWFERQIIALPPQMTDELRVWFEVMHHGSTVPPRSRPRAPVTITTRTRWALPALQSWGKAGHSSLREITRADVAAALPPSGNERATLGLALRSIFGTLRGRKLIFTNPIAHIKIGEIERRQPLPLNPSDIRGLLDSPDSAAAAVAALIAFHGLRPEELRGLQLTDIRDGRIWLPDRSVPLAEPVEQRVATWLDERGRRWPNTANAHLFIHLHTACDTGPIGRGWFWRHLPIAPTKIRDDRLLDEAQATSGDVRRISDFFGVTVKAAVRYAATLDHPGLVNREQPERPS